MERSNNLLIDQYQQVRKTTESIVAPLNQEDFVAQPIVDVSPPKWHLGHSTWFFENFILKPWAIDYRIYDVSFAYIFNSYYESQGERILRNKRGSLTRPSTEAIFEYRKYVDKHMLELLNQRESLTDELVKFLLIGLNHEQQHQELLVTDIKYILGSNPLLPLYRNFDEKKEASFQATWLPIESGLYTIGYGGEEFCFDNEQGQHQTYLHGFSFLNRLITNEEYIEFIEDGGYQKVELWLMEGWEWVKQQAAKAPFYWFQKDNRWYNYKLNGVQEVNLNEAVTHINFYEAEAYARWRGARLLTEQEWEVAAGKYGQLCNDSQFLEEEQFHPGIAKENQLFGTAWEWTNSAYLPYPFYKQEAGALGEYNGKFMINQMVLRGGSCATPRSHFRPSYRNFFHPHLQWQFTGIRIAKLSEPINE